MLRPGKLLPLCSFKQKYVTDHRSLQLMVHLPLK